MIIIKIEMWPGGFEEYKYTLGTATITNIGGTETHGNYKAVFGLKKKPNWRMSEVRSFPRLRKNVWYLLRDALLEALA